MLRDRNREFYLDCVSGKMWGVGVGESIKEKPLTMALKTFALSKLYVIYAVNYLDKQGRGKSC